MSDTGPTVFKGRYELHRKLARGGMSDVYLARDQVLDRPVAVKVMFPEYAKDATFVERFRREAQAAAKLNHPNVVAIYDWGEEMGTYFIAMEYVDGRSLSEIIRAEGHLHPRRVAEITADVASALGFAHKNGVVHRDVKPGNVIIETNGQVKVADFGIAQALSGSEQAQLTRVGAVMGTATYFSPEQAQGKQVDPRSDLYSLGCVMFEMLTTRPPFSGDSPVAIAYKHVQEQPPTPSSLGVDVPAPLQAIIMKLLAKDPDGRYTSAEDLRADLRRYLEGHPVLALAGVVGATAVGVGVAGAAAAGATGPNPTMAMPATTAVPATMTPGGRTVVDDYEPPPRRGGSGIFIGLLVLLLLALGVALFYIGSNLNNKATPKQIPVPSVINRPVDTATVMLTQVGFTVKRVDQPNPQVPAGTVFDQNPKGQANEGSEVTINVSTGQGEVTVPDVVNQTEAQARATLERLGFVVNATREPDNTVPKDVVKSQNPAKDVKAEKGSPVTLVVSDGRDSAPVPSVAGLEPGAAGSVLAQAGFRNVQQASEFSATVPQGRVIRTDPGSGVLAAINTPIRMIVSNGPEPTTTTTAAPTTTTTRPPSTTTTSRPPTTTSPTILPPTTTAAP